MKKSFTLLFALMVATMLSANNISISNIKMTGQNTTGQFTMVKFDISWENSWRTSAAPNNWDAAWVFVKYRVSGGAWNHATLSSAGNVAPAGCTVSPASEGTGAFIYRDAEGTGAFPGTGTQLRWNYGVDGVTDNAVIDIRIFAVEMVYVPSGTFTAGSGGAETGAFYTYPATTNPYQITGEGEITVGTATGDLYYNSTSPLNIGDQSGPIPAAFPKGFNAFYCMKYEISQQEYVDFLNSLTYTQQVTRTPIAPNSVAGTYFYNTYRNKIKISTSGVANTTPAVYATDCPDIACNYIDWADVAAYFDWSGLRPMTELEFEKACRGTVTTVPNEFAWGTTGIANLTYTLSNGGANNEAIATNYSTTGGNAAYNLTTPLNGSINGPLRVGIFANTTSDRVAAGATYYGIMEMSGNLRERPVTVGNVTGRSFNGTHGNGILDATGNADASTWPGTDAIGAGFRGGSWNLNATYLRVSNRSNAANAADNHSILYGGRGVRLTPGFVCGSNMTINHVDGDVAPVSKTVTYGTVTNIPGETSKCWITSNLGADHQATAVDDATEASAGWYWQFNRKQGYKHDGTTVTPAWTITSINESSDWETIKDPCTLELGTGWRIPTFTEWTNVDASGNWINWNDPWNSGLKMHAAGYLGSSDGSLGGRGSGGYYWSSTQDNASLGWNLFFYSGNSNMYSGSKAYGFSVRCVRDY